LQISNFKFQISRIKAQGTGRIGQVALGALIPILFLLQARAVLHMPTDGRTFGALAQLAGVGRQTSVYKNYSYYDSAGYTQLGHIPADYDRAAAARIQDIVNQSPGPAFSEEATWSMNAGKAVVTNPTQLLNLYNNGLNNPASLVEMVNQQRFGVVVLRAQFYPLPVLDAIGQKYRTLTDIDMNGFTYHILIPR
jgi:hypothetical protein